MGAWSDARAERGTPKRDELRMGHLSRDRRTHIVDRVRGSRTLLHASTRAANRRSYTPHVTAIAFDTLNVSPCGDAQNVVLGSR